MSSIGTSLSRATSVVGALFLIGAAAVAPTDVGAQSFRSTGSGLVTGSLDPNWLVSADRSSFSASFAPAFKWAEPGWISNTPSGNNPPFGPLVYFDFRQTFDLTGFDAASTLLSFQWGCDDSPSGWPVITPYFTVNGGAAQGAGTCGAYNYGATVDVSGFQDGVNTLDFFIQGNGQTDGLLLRTMSVEAVTSTPEPATLALLGTGLIAVIGIGSRRRNVGK